MPFIKGHKPYNVAEKTIKNCEFCDKQFLVTPSNLKRRFCSYYCTYESRKTGNWKRCLICGKKFWIYKYELSTRKFCSSNCCYINKRNQKKIRRLCQVCGKEFYVIPSKVKYRYAKCCSRKCHYKSRIGTKRPWVVREKIKNTHKIKQFGFKKGVHTSPQTEFKYGKDNLNFNNYSSFEPYTKKFNKTLKELIRQRDNHTCQLCGRTQKELKYTFPVHHIDYDKKNCEPINLITLCRGCHTKTNTNRDYWINFFSNHSTLKKPLKSSLCL